MTDMTSFWRQVGLNVVGPFVTAVVGSLLIGILVQRITRAAQDRRAAQELRHSLIAELTGVAANLHMRLLMYGRERDALVGHLTGEGLEKTAEARQAARYWRWRQHRRHSHSNQPAHALPPLDRISELRRELGEQYVQSRRDGAVLEARLGAYFADARVSTAWHAVMDCLAVRYFRAIEFRSLDRIHQANAYGTDGRFHSGIQRSDLDGVDSWQRLAQAYRAHLQATSAFVLELPLRGKRPSLWQRLRARTLTGRILAPDSGSFTYEVR